MYCTARLSPHPIPVFAVFWLGFDHRRRIHTKEKAKVVAAALKAEFIQFLAALGRFKDRMNSTNDELNKRIISSYSSNCISANSKQQRRPLTFRLYLSICYGFDQVLRGFTCSYRRCLNCWPSCRRCRGSGSSRSRRCRSGDVTRSEWRKWRERRRGGGLDHIPQSRGGPAPRPPSGVSSGQTAAFSKQIKRKNSLNTM